MNVFGVNGLGIKEQTICNLERGTIVTKFFPRRKPEKKSLLLRRETGQVVWCPITSEKDQRNSFEGSLEIRDIKEVRAGRNSKEFDKWAEESKKADQQTCFVLFYGAEFKLRALSVAALYQRERNMWISGLRDMMHMVSTSSYPVVVERWLRKEFYAMENPRETLTLKELKSFLSKINCKISTQKLSEYFCEVDQRRRHEIGFDAFSKLYQKLMLTPNILQDCFDRNFPYSKNDQIVSLQEFQRFLVKEQDDSEASDKVFVSNLIKDFIQDVQRDVQEPYLTLPEFVDYLFSKHNEIWNGKCNRVYQDMTRPLSHYWISSSHNTYLTGDQFSSDSSTEAYARALRMGCRCIELDCWDGPDNMPLIFHGHTFTSKIKFTDVIKTIRDHAFVTSEYPVILSIEQNCSLKQQRNMADAMREVFKDNDMLLIQQIDKGEQELPSPEQLKRKIILKHKKLPEGEERNSLSVDEGDCDLRNSEKEEILFILDLVDRRWVPHRFALRQHKLMYRPEREDARDEENELESPVPKPKDSIHNNELHFGENWFHGKLEGGREEAEMLLKDYSHLGDGTFLVRESATFVGDYCLSFWRRDRPNHCRIKLKHENGLTKYYLLENLLFDSLYSLIMHYRQNVLRSAEFSITLREPVPQPKKHENKEWYHPNMTRDLAEKVLSQKQNDGTFLVRPSDTESNTYVISFWAHKKIKHCRITVDGRLYLATGTQFESLVSLVNYYAKSPLYKTVKLTYPITRDMLKRMSNSMVGLGDFLDDTMADGTSSYMDPSSVEEKITVKALFDYKAQRDDELSFCKHAIITNVKKKENEMWWTGDYGGKKQHYFPANYVTVIETTEGCGDENANSTHKEVDVNGAIVEIDTVDIVDPDRPIHFILRVQTPSMDKVFDIGCESESVAIDWMAAIKEAAQNASALAVERRKKEKNLRVAKEMSDMIIYFRSVPFKEDRELLFYEMCSFSETKADKYFFQQYQPHFIKYHRKLISRVYPKGQRLDSSNFNPIPFWNIGSQMIALNFQTADKMMQINQAKFRDNGVCGYILKPDFMFTDVFDPNIPHTLIGVEGKTINIRIIGGRHLFKSGRNINSPLVEVELLGASFDAGVKHKTKAVADNGFNPIWNEICEFHVKNPHFAMLRFEVQDEDMFGEPNFIGQAVFPVNCIKPGYRSVPLKNKYSEEIELAVLLVHISIRTG
ncbi:1-phosphatidylinositol 4,5-bisphosphate phosphodiesterase gamma [Sergentomyia squamirostris]